MDARTNRNAKFDEFEHATEKKNDSRKGSLELEPLLLRHRTGLLLC